MEVMDGFVAISIPIVWTIGIILGASWLRKPKSFSLRVFILSLGALPIPFVVINLFPFFYRYSLSLQISVVLCLILATAFGLLGLLSFIRGKLYNTPKGTVSSGD